MLEAYAKRHVEAGLINLKTVDRALHLFAPLVPYSKSRQNILGGGVSGVKSMLLGLYSYAGDVGVTRHAREFPHT